MTVYSYDGGIKNGPVDDSSIIWKNVSEKAKILHIHPMNPLDECVMEGHVQKWLFNNSFLCVYVLNKYIYDF